MKHEINLTFLTEIGMLSGQFPSIIALFVFDNGNNMDV